MNEIIEGDCLDILKKAPDACVDLIYVDPPFFTQKTHKRTRKKTGQSYSFDDKFNSLEDYLNWLMLRCKQFHRILKATGSIYLQCNDIAAHYIKVELDKIFGMRNFKNEIIWCYANPGTAIHKFKRKHDTIFLYHKSKKFIFNVQRYTEHHLVGLDMRRFKPMSRTKRRTISSNPISRSFYRTKYPELYKGPALSDWWIDIPSFGSACTTKERLNFTYPTQKPEKLLDRIIRASSNEGDVVIDPMCGSGTTCYVAEQLNRKWIGIDMNPQAVEVSRNRMKNVVPKIAKDKVSDFF